MTVKPANPLTSDALFMSGIETRSLPHSEAVVGFGFRCVMQAYLNGAYHWMTPCGQLFEQEFAEHAHEAVARLAIWGEAVRTCALRRIEVLPARCWSFCRDECLAVTLVAASRHRECPALQMCACMLLGNAQVAPALEAADAFCATLERAGAQFASPSADALSLTHTLH